MKAMPAVPLSRARLATLVTLFFAAALTSLHAHALPVFNRQTGQNCMACHAGGQFPELTPYGRLFKLTGYTLGERNTVPLSAMAVVSDSHVQNKDQLIFATASAFVAGKITDNLGAFLQVTYDNYASQSDDGKFHGHTQADNMDIRYADRVVTPGHDIIFGVSFNNNPSVQDPWNSAAAW